MTKDIIREAQNNKKTILAAWASLGSPYGIELAGEAGWQVIVIDQQHGIGGNGELIACLTAARAASLPALVRVASLDEGLIGRALDAGAQGVMVPMINSADDAKRLVQAVKYPPSGMRSWGPYRGRFFTKGEYFSEANDWTIACAQIETREALENLDEILLTDGLDMVLVGPNDLCISLTEGQARDIRHPDVLKALEDILTKCRKHSVIAGVFANDADYAKPLIKAGWDVVAVGTDVGLLGSAFQELMGRLS